MKDTLSLLANIGVVAGLFFLGIQIYQDQKLTRAQLTSNLFNEENARRLVIMGEDSAIVLAKVNDGEPLTRSESIVAGAYYDSRIGTWQRNFQLEDLGLFEGIWREGFNLRHPVWENEFALNHLQNRLESGIPGVSSTFMQILNDEASRIQAMLVQTQAKGMPDDA